MTLWDNWVATPKWDKEQYVWNEGDPLGHFLVLSCSEIKVNGNYKNSIWAGLLMTRPLRNEDLGHPRVPAPPEALPEGKGNFEWVTEEFSYKYQLWHVTI